MAIGGACTLSAFQCVRHLTSSPDVRITKSERALGVLEDKHFFKEGAQFREHGLRGCAIAPHVLLPHRARGASAPHSGHAPNSVCADTCRPAAGASLPPRAAGRLATLRNPRADPRCIRSFLRTQEPQIFATLNAKLGGALRCAARTACQVAYNSAVLPSRRSVGCSTGGCHAVPAALETRCSRLYVPYVRVRYWWPPNASRRQLSL